MDMTHPKAFQPASQCYPVTANNGHYVIYIEWSICFGGMNSICGHQNAARRHRAKKERVSETATAHVLDLEYCRVKVYLCVDRQC